MYQKGPANRFDTFPFNDTGKSDQGSVEALILMVVLQTLNIIVYLTLHWKITLNSLGLKSTCFLESLKGREEIKVAKCRRQTDGESEKQQINEHFVALTSFFSETLNLHRFFYP